MEVMEDGHHRWGDVRLPLLWELRWKAQSVVHGEYSRERFELEEGAMDYALWHDLCRYNPARLGLDGKLNHAGHLDWWLSWAELGDPDAHGFSGHWLSPE